MNQDKNNINGSNGIPDIFGVPKETISNQPTPPAPTNEIPQESDLMDSIPVFDIPNFNDVSKVEPVIPEVVPVTPVVPQQPPVVSEPLNSEIGPQSVPTASTPTISEPEVEELNPWVAAVEAEEESNVVVPQEPKEPVVQTPMAPHTVEDLIATAAPLTFEPPKKEKKLPWKLIGIIGGIIIGVILIVLAIAFFNKAGNKTLSCTLSDTNGGMRYRTTNTFVFKGKTMDTLGTKVEYIVADEADHATELATLKAAIEYMDQNVKQLKGTTTKIESTTKAVTYDITLKHNQIETAEWEQKQEQFVDVTAIEYLEKDYNTIKKEMTEQGYTCK